MKGKKARKYIKLKKAFTFWASKRDIKIHKYTFETFNLELYYYILKFDDEVIRYTKKLRNLRWRLDKYRPYYLNGKISGTKTYTYIMDSAKRT